MELGIGQQTIDGRNNPRYGRDSAETQVLALEDAIGEQVAEALRVPPAFGLAGVNLATWPGFGSVTYWNACVAVTEMHGSGTYCTWGCS